MTIHDGIAFHNVAEMAPAPGGGWHLTRFPPATWRPLDSTLGDLMVRSSNGCELRLVTTARRVRLYLRSLHGPAELVHLRGNQLAGYERIEAGPIACLQVELPPLEPNRIESIRRCGGFAPQVYRLYIPAAAVAYHGMDDMGGTVRPPTAEELPRRRWLAYGSSITFGGTTYHTYVNAAAQMLEASVCNLGMGGSCFIEKQIADFIAARDDWDFASFELGINMLNPSRDNVRYAQKVNYLLDTVTARHPKKPIFLITIFDSGGFYEKDPSDWQRDGLEKDEIVRAAAARYPGQVTLLEGRKLVSDFRGFQTDLLHPEPFASTRLGLAVASAMESRLAEGG